jgi:hydroxymethylpyrimidine pyrophosphatase-like HAD family hydrolase
MIILVDVDGTLALRNGREPFDWHLVHTDEPNSNVIQLVRLLNESGHNIIFISGRQEDLHHQTSLWIEKHVSVQGVLLMRPSGDFRSDEMVEEDLIRRHLSDFSQILFVLDDRTPVVRMWREKLGLTCLQVAEGNF